MNTQPMNSSNGPSRFSGPNPKPKPRLRDTLAKYDRNNAIFEQKIADLEEKTTGLEKTIADLKKTVTVHEKTITDQTQQIEYLWESRQREKFRESTLMNWLARHLYPTVSGLEERTNRMEYTVVNILHGVGSLPGQYGSVPSQIHPSGNGFIPRGANPNGGGTILAHLEANQNSGNMQYGPGQKHSHTQCQW